MKLKTANMCLVILLAAWPPTLTKLPLVEKSSGVYPGNTWQKYTSPEEAGWSSDELNRAKWYAQRIGTAAFLVIYEGKIVTSWGDIERKYKVHSIRKSFLNSLYGIHVKEGHIDLNKTMAELGIDDNPPSLTDEEKTATVNDLIKSRSGVYHKAASQSAIPPERGSHPPGTFFYYNNWDFNALGAIFEQETGTKIFEEFKMRIADPLQMEDYQIEEDTEYRFQLEKSIHPAYHFWMSSLDMARFGLLYLRGGKWKDEQIVPADWIKESIRPYSLHATQARAYGYLWWIQTEGYLKKLGMFSALGRGQHSIDILPKLRLLFVHRVQTEPRSEWRRVPYECRMQLLALVLDANPNLVPDHSFSDEDVEEQCE